VGLDLIVGIRALIDDDEGRAALDTDLARFNGALTSAGISQHAEPEASRAEVFTCQMWGYLGLHVLRRLAAHLQSHLDPEPFSRHSDATDDRILKDLYRQWPTELDERGVATLRRTESVRRFDHLVFHSDADGMYLPIAFDDVVIGAGEDGMGFAVGSSYALRRECQELADWLELPLDFDPEASEVWAAADSAPTVGAKWKRYGVESFCCLRLHRASSRSIDQGMALVFA
jgi:hypothetical protein